MNKLSQDEPTVRVIKIREEGKPPGYLGDGDWHELLSNNGWTVVDTNSKRIFYRFGAAPGWELYQTELASTLSNLDSTDLCIFDLAFDGKPLEEVLPRLISAVDEASTRVGSIPPVLIVLSAHSVLTGDAFDSVANGFTLPGKIAIFTPKRTLIGHLADLGLDQLLNTLEPRIDPEGTIVRRRKIQAYLIRQRGVFKDQFAHTQYYRFRYILEEGAFQDVVMFVDNLVRTELGDASCIIVDTTTSFWMRSLAKKLHAKASRETQVIEFDGDSVTGEQKTLVQNFKGQCAVLCGVTQNGGTSNRAARAFNISPEEDVKLRMAVVCDASYSRDEVQEVGGWYKTTLSTGPWHFLLNAPVQHLVKSDWRISAAKAMDDVKDLRNGSAMPPSPGVHDVRMRYDDLWSEIGLWDLISSCGVDCEQIPLGSNWRRSQSVVKFMPAISSIDDQGPNAGRSATATLSDQPVSSHLDRLTRYDANWLAELVLLRFQIITARADREELVIVVPEKSEGVSEGTHKVMNAMIRARRVKVLTITREEILNEVKDNDAFGDAYLRFHSRDKWVVFDESRVSGRTFESICRCMQSVDIEIDAAGTVFDAGWARDRLSDLPFFSLCSWRHIAEVSRISSINV